MTADPIHASANSTHELDRFLKLLDPPSHRGRGGRALDALTAACASPTSTREPLKAAIKERGLGYA